MVAFASLKHQYEKKGDKWVKKSHSGPSDPQAARGPTTRKKSTDPDRAPTAGGKVAKTDSEARERQRRLGKKTPAPVGVEPAPPRTDLSSVQYAYRRR